MRAYCFTGYGGPETEVLLDLPVPAPGPGQVLVSVRAAGVEPADWKVRAGLRASSIVSTFPAVLGRAVAGVVAAAGPGVDWPVGAEVFGAVSSGHGGYAEYTLVDAAGCAAKPAEVSFADAATIPVALGTAYDAVDQLRIGPDDTLLVIGAGGGVGVPAVQLARARHARVIGPANENRREIVESFGAQWLNTDQPIPPGVTAVLDTVGGEVLVAWTPPGARLLSIADPDLATALGGSGVTRRRTTAVISEVAALVGEGRLDAYVRARYPLERAGEALARVESGHAPGKTVIEIGG